MWQNITGKSSIVYDRKHQGTLWEELCYFGMRYSWSSTNSWSNSASWEHSERRSRLRQLSVNQPWTQTSPELWMVLTWAAISACHFGFFFKKLVFVSQFCAVQQVCPEESFLHISCKPTQDIETKIPRNGECLWISLHLKISEFPPNDNVKLSYDMIY